MHNACDNDRASMFVALSLSTVSGGFLNERKGRWAIDSHKHPRYGLAIGQADSSIGSMDDKDDGPSRESHRRISQLVRSEAAAQRQTG